MRKLTFAIRMIKTQDNLPLLVPITKRKRPYKEPVFLFTSCSLRFAAFAGWYSAFGDSKNTENWVHQAYSEWAKEMGAGRKFSFFDRYNDDIWKYIPPETLKKLVDNFFKSLKKEIKKAKSSTTKG